MTLTDAFLAVCLSAVLADTNAQIRKTIRRCEAQLPKKDRPILKLMRESSNPRKAIFKALSLL